jgi:hypothetical protein
MREVIRSYYDGHVAGIEVNRALPLVSDILLKGKVTLFRYGIIHAR